MAKYDTRPFHNFTDQDFEFEFDGEKYSVKAGEKKMLVDYIAVHAAKHLTDRIIIGRFNKPGTKVLPLRDEAVRKEIIDKCLPAEWEVKVKEETPKVTPEVAEEVAKETAEETPNYAGMNMPQLRKVAKEKGIKVSPTTKKKEILEKLL